MCGQTPKSNFNTSTEPMEGMSQPHDISDPWDQNHDLPTSILAQGWVRALSLLMPLTYLSSSPNMVHHP